LQTITYTYILEDPKSAGTFLQLKISRKDIQNEGISLTVATTIPTGTSKSAVLSKFLDAKSGLVVLEEVPGTISLYFLDPTGLSPTLAKTNSYSYVTSGAEPL
jgi:hypothetical protein